MKMYFINIIEELKSTRSSWKIKLILGVGFEYDDKKVENDQTIMLETNLGVFADDIMKQEYNDVNKLGRKWI